VSDYDSPWKGALDLFLEAFLAFFFPQAYAEIDWSRDYKTLETELMQVIREAAVGRHRADKLVQVWLRNGQETWLLIHVEVQSQVEEDFPRRMFTYNYRIFDLYNQTVVSLAVLGDEREAWRPDRFGYGRWGCEVGIRFPIVKLLDYGADEAALEANANPFAAVVLAHLKTQETRQDAEARRSWKIRLVKGLYARGLTKEQVRELFRLIDWMMDLPEGLEGLFWQELTQFEEEKRMPYVTSVERMALKEGERKGILRGIRLGLKLKFGAEALQLLPQIESVTDLDKLSSIHDAIETAANPEEISRLCS
jgi:hypothetical protein